MAWTYQYWNGSAWTSALTLDNPWGVDVDDASTDSVSTIINGETGHVSLSTKTWHTMNLSWDMKTSTLKTLLQGFLDNGYILKLTDHNSEVYVVKIKSLKKTHKVVNGALGYALTAECVQHVVPT